MGPKKGRDLSADENYWRICIEDAPLDEENWKVKVIIIEAAGSDQDRIYLNKFEIFAAEEKRFIIKNICKTETTFMVNQLGGEKKVKDDNLRVFEEGQAYLKDKKDIPPDVLALVIKHLILKMKEEYLFIKRQRLEVREGMRRESSTMIDRVEVRGTVSGKPPETPEPTPPPKGKGKKGEAEVLLQTPEPTEGKKYNTQLRVRGEEWRDKVYIDDFPQDGPNLYVAITGFVEPLLAGCLVKIGIPLTAIVQVRIDSTTTSVPSSLLRSTKRGQSQTEMLTEKSMKFWGTLQQLRIQRDTADTFKNTAFIVFSPPYWDSESLTGNPVKIYDELCYLMYDIQDLTRQHSHYIENMDIINVPQDMSKLNKYFKYYHQQIQDLPLECVTIYSLLDCILQTVSNYQASEEKCSTNSLTSALTIDQKHQVSEDNEKITKAEKLVKDIFNTLCKTDENKKYYRITYGEEYEHHKDPVIIQYGDIVKYTTFQLGDIDLNNIVWTTLIGMPFNYFWCKQNRIKGELEAKINLHVNVLLSCFERDDVETAEINRLMHILACRKLYNNRSSLKKKHLQPSTIFEFKKVYLKRSVLAEPLPQCPSLVKSTSSMTQSFPIMTKSENISNYSYGEDPETNRIKFLFDCPDISELVSAAEIANGYPISHMIDDYEHFEDFLGVSAFQILLEAFNNFNCVDYKYCEVTDCFVLMFFNSHDKDGIAREEWRSHIPTPLCLQDFFDFILEENYEWIQNEEKIYNENCLISTQSVCKEAVNPFAGTSCIENMDVEIELLIEGSLKHQEITDLEDDNPETVETNTTSKRTTTSPTSMEDSRSSRKPKSSQPSTPKHLTHSFMADGPDSDISIQIPRKPFIGYDLGNRRVEVFGHNSTFFSDDGTRVISKYMLTIPNNLEYIILNVIPGNNVNEFWLHRALGEDVTSEITDMCQSFRITSKNDLLININKLNYQVSGTLLKTSFDESQKIKDNMKSTPDKVHNENLQIFQHKYFHALSITWPNGLITESVHLDNSSDISHIKQFYINPLPHINEEMRCVSLNGEVIIFRPSGIIEVLQPDGSFIKIIKYGKRIIQPEQPEEMASETSSDKSKKGKPKEKDKISKSSSKSSKNVVNDNASEVKPPKYELFIDEFETIDSNGLRQKWINDIPYIIEKLLIRTATDYCLREVYTRRMDGTNILCNKDGVQVVTFPNNTRIISQYVIEVEEVYPEWTDEEKEFFDMLDSDTIDTETLKSKLSVSQKSYVGGTYPHSTSAASTYSTRFNSMIQKDEFKEIERTDGYISIQIIFTIEHENFTSVTVDKASKKITMESPNNTKVVMDMNNNYNIKLDDATIATFDGRTLKIDYEACAECSSFTTTSVKVATDEMSSVTKMHQHWLKMKDSFGKKIVVNEEGHISILEELCSTEMYHTEKATNIEDCNEDPFVKQRDTKSEISIISHGKCREMYQAKNMRFFVLNRELSCSELVHRVLLDQYKKTCRWQPWCSISQHDTFGDHRCLLSILTPVHLTESEKWLMASKLADKPKYLAYKDLKKDHGKGFYHWMRPYERFAPKSMKPDKVLLPRLPRAFVLRTLEQQWKETERQDFKGARELLAAILRYRRIMESDSETILHVPIKDTRSDTERCTDDIIQALGQRIYEDLKNRLSEDVEGRAKATVTTKAMPVSSVVSVKGELEEEESCKQRQLEEERESLVKQVEAAEKMSPNLKRYWRRRAEEYKEEQFYKYLLREGSVPPYFRNVLGGAIWWEMNNAAGEAATAAERKKMNCVCAEEGTTHTDDSTGPLI